MLLARGFYATVENGPAYPGWATFPGRGSMPLTLFYVTMTRPKMGIGEERRISVKILSFGCVIRLLALWGPTTKVVFRETKKAPQQ